MQASSLRCSGSGCSPFLPHHQSPPRELACRLTDKGSCPIHIGDENVVMAPSLFLAVIYTGKNGRLLKILLGIGLRVIYPFPVLWEWHAVCCDFREISICSSMVKKPQLLYDQVKKASQHNAAWLMVG